MFKIFIEFRQETAILRSLKTVKTVKVNKQDFLQVFQGSGIGKIEDNLTSADPLSYITNESRVDLVSKVSVSCLT